MKRIKSRNNVWSNYVPFRLKWDMGRGKGYDDVKANSLKGGRKKEEKEEKKTSDFQFQGPTSFHSIPRHLRGCRG